MSPLLRNRLLDRHEALIIFSLGVLLLLPGIWCETGITGQDEYWLSFRTPMETMEHNGWFTPWVNGEPRLKKPPLLYWAIQLTYELLGISLFAARIWGVFSGAALASCSALLYRVLFKKSGILAGLITLATITVAVEGRRAMLDLPLAFFTCMGVFFALKWGKSGSIWWILLAALSLGLSFLTKGPVGIILFGVAAVSALFIFKKWSYVLSRIPQVVLGLGFFLAVSLPWPIAMASLWPGFLKVVNSEVAARGIGGFHIGSSFSTLGGAFGLVFPWSLLLAAALIRAVCRARHAQDNRALNDLWLSAWFLGCVVPFFFIGTFARYMTPLIPAACVLCAGWLEQVEGAWKTWLLRVSACLLAFVAVPFCLFFVWFGQGKVMALICLFVVGLMLWITFKKNEVRMTAFTAALLFCLMLGGLYPTLGINAMPANIPDIVGSAPVAAFNSSQPSMLSIRLKRSAVRIRSFNRDDLCRLKSLDGFVFVREGDIEIFERVARELGIFFERAGRFKTFYSRQAWIRFVREDASANDWKRAIETRSLADLRPTICFYRVHPNQD